MNLTVPVAARRDLAHRSVRVLGVVAAAIVVVIAVGSCVGLVLTHVLDQTWLVRFDERVAHAFADNRTPFLDRATGWATFPADPVPVGVVWAASLVVTYLALRRWWPVLFVLFSVGGEKLSYLFTTLVVERPRPEVETIGVRHVTSSFPSGHVGSAVSLYGAIATLLVIHWAHRSRRATVAAVAVVSVIGITVALCRMYRGFHFVTDVIAGAAIGAVWLLIAARVVARFEHEAPAHPADAGRSRR